MKVVLEETIERAWKAFFDQVIVAQAVRVGEVDRTTTTISFCQPGHNENSVGRVVCWKDGVGRC